MGNYFLYLFALNFKIDVGDVLLKDFLNSEFADLFGMFLCIVGMFLSVYVSMKSGSYLTVLLIPTLFFQFCLFFGYWKKKRNKR